MPISKDLLLAILSMDSYNRGYGAGISDSGENDPDGLGHSGSIGSAVIKDPLDYGIGETQYQAWQTAGFYAIAYDVSAAGVGVKTPQP